MLHALLIFVVTAAISFAGSLQLGPVNLAVIHATLTRTRRAGLLIGAGGSVPEWIYAFPALFASEWLKRNTFLLWCFQWAIVPVLVLIGLMNLLKKQKPVQLPETENLTQHTADFFKGFFLALLNPQLFPFWVTVLVFFNGSALLNVSSGADQVAFMLGTGAGEFLLVLLAVWLSRRYRTWLLGKLEKWKINRVFGILYIGIALLQTIKLIALSFRK